MAVNVVTGQGGTNHISSDNARYANAATFGKGKYVLNIGNKFSATVESPNLVRIMDGMAINQGTQIGIDPDDYEDVGIENGVTGVNRNDIIVMRYIRNDSTSIESGVMEVISGESVSGTPTDPAITSGNILDGKELVDDFPLYRVKVRGLTIEGLDTLFTVWQSDMEKNRDNIASLSSTKADKTTMTTELNKKVNKTDVQSAVNTSTNPVSSNAVRTALASKADTSSVNSALALKADKTETASIEQEIEDIKAGTLKGALMESVNDVLGAKNLLEITAESRTIGGVTFTVDKGKGTVTANGTADTDNNSWFPIIGSSTGASDPVLTLSEDCILTGCPSGGGTNLANFNYRIAVIVVGGNKWSGTYHDFGDGVLIPAGTAIISVECAVRAGKTVSNIVFKPMIRPAAYESATFAPYAKSNRELTMDVALLPENAKKNLLEITANSKTDNGVTFTVDKSTGIIKVSGTNTSSLNTWLQLSVPNAFTSSKLILSGAPTGAVGKVALCALISEAGTGDFVDTGDGVEIPANTYIHDINIRVFPNQTVDYTFYPMLRPAGTSPDFVPYMYSNLELSHMYEGNETYNLLEITAGSQTINGVTFTVDKEAGTVTVNGTASANASFYLTSTAGIGSGTYILSGCPLGGGESTYYINGNFNSTWTNATADIGSGKNVTVTGVATQFAIAIVSGTTVPNLTFKPMLRKSTAPSAFVPYRKTNEQLTGNVSELTAQLSNKVNKSDVQTSVNTSTNPVSSSAVNTALTSKLSQSDVQTQLLANNKPIASNVVYNLVNADSTSAGRTYLGILVKMGVLIPIGITTYRRNENNSQITCTDAYADNAENVSFTGRVLKYQNAFLAESAYNYTSASNPPTGSMVYVTLSGVM